MNRDKDTLESFQHAIEHDSKYEEAYFNSAGLYLSTKNYRKTIKDYTKAIEIDSTYIEAYYNPAIVYKIINKMKESENDICTTKKIAPKTVSYLQK